MSVCVYLIGEKNVGGRDENFEGVTKFFPNILSPDQNFYPISLSATETFNQNFIFQPKIKSKFLHPGLEKLVKTLSYTRSFFEQVKETNPFGQFSRVEVTKM